MLAGIVPIRACPSPPSFRDLGTGFALGQHSGFDDKLHLRIDFANLGQPSGLILDDTHGFPRSISSSFFPNIAALSVNITATKANIGLLPSRLAARR